MVIEVGRVSGDDDIRAFTSVVAAAFGEPAGETTPERRALLARLRPEDGFVVLREEGRVLGGCFAHAFELTMPGGATVPAAGLAGVGVDPTHTGRGLLRAIVGTHLERSRAQGDVVSVLLASESGLYRRFGYGWSSSMAVYEIDSRSAALRQPVEDPGTLELLTDPASAKEPLRRVHDALAGQRAGTLSRSEAWWDAVLSPEPSWLGGGPQLAVVHRDPAGRPDGYVLYTVDSSGGVGHWLADATLKVRELVGLTLGVELALWRFCTTVPLTRHVRWELAPIELGLRWHLADPRQLRTISAHDLLWVRPLDVAAFLSARRYDRAGRTTVHVEWPDDPEVHGAWTIEAEGGSAIVRRGGEPAVSLSLPLLAPVVLGERRLTELAAAGLVGGAPEAVRAASDLFATDTRPFTFTKF